MSIPLERLEAEALELPTRERAALAHRLIASLDEDGDDDPTEVELAWEEEIQRRLDEYRRGDVQTVSSADVFAKARALLK
ncbi:MAG TPA: addiction module protein [Longimicrobium sp.]|jgi:putative addiction module component (TIGR02574 family)